MGKTPKIEFRLVEELPSSLVHGFLLESYADESVRAQISRNISDASVKVVSFFEGTPIGFACAGSAEHLRRNTLYGLGLYVLPKYREMKIGTRLIRRLEWQARKMGFTRVVLSGLRPGSVSIVKRQRERLISRSKRSGAKEINFLPCSEKPIAEIILPPKPNRNRKHVK